MTFPGGSKSFPMEIVIAQLLLFSSSIFWGAYGFINSPKIVTKDGNLIFESGLNRNISFRLHGTSRININDEFDIMDLLLLSKRGRNSSTHADWSSIDDESAWHTAASDLAALKLRVFGAQGIDKRLRRLQNRTRTVNQLLRRYQTRLQNVETRVAGMIDQLEVDNCRSNPCENGGTCFNMFNGFVCKCSQNFEGPTCDKDVNECALFAGTDLGCQNGGQCVNAFGSYSCICSPGWFGMHCTKRKGDCLQSSAWEICGHGTCVASNDNNFGYKCICDQGWKTNGLTPACSVDVDECSESHPPCATKCINLPGYFTCAPCGPGLTGSGLSCRDIDECAVHNGGCSLSPRVPCINSYGSFRCGECPLGWTGDGRTCTRSTDGNALAASCSMCHPEASCAEVSNTVVCTCPFGMVGSGVGANGCVRDTTVNCNSSPCLNGGTCVPRGNSYFCLCRRGFQGSNCNALPSPCTPNPCHNSGRCRPLGGTEFQCQCAPGYSGRLCDTSTSRCGGTLRGETGRLKYPEEGGVYAHRSQCAWVIRTDEARVLNVTFNAFDLEDATECRFDWLQINDGRTAAAQLIGRFCGSRLPRGGNIISTTNDLYLWFRSDNSSAREGFDLSWTSVRPVCGGLLEVDTHGTLASPGSPGNYPKNRDCRWYLRTTNSKRIKLTIFSMAIESHDDCNFDYVEVIDAISGNVLEKFCNSSRPAPLLLPTNEAVIHFHSDNEGTDTGFQIHYSTEPRLPGCGGTYTAKQETIRSPDSIQEPISCEYDIKMAVGESISMEFTKFEMGLDDCIEIYDVRADRAELMLHSKHCGGLVEPPVTFNSLYNAVQIKFYSKGGTFALKYKADCSYTYESSQAVIVSPNYPQLRNSDRLCTYKILTEPNTVIALHLVDFEVRDSSLESSDCAFTYLKINDGLDRNIMGPFCGNSTPPVDITSKANMLVLLFQTGLTSHGRGFKLEYRALPMHAAGCGGVFTKPGATIRLPTDDEGEYMHDLECYWVIMAPPGHGILLSWKSFSLEDSIDCIYDYVEVYDNLANSEHDKPLGRFCDTRPPPEILSHSRTLTLKFVSDSSDAMGGFEATYEFVDYTKSCGGNIFSSSGQVNSPQWPMNYSNGQDCTWTITAPPGTQIELQIDTFDLEDAYKCGNDWLEIRNGGSANSSLVGFYCGKNIPHRIPSFTNQMRLHFHSDAFISARGFLIRWHIFSNGCGGVLNSDLGVITSPFYPSPYPNNAQCEWLIRVTQGSSVHLTIEDLHMEDLYNCNYDSLEIFDGRTGADHSLAKVCSLGEDNKPMQFVTSGHSALVRFTTDSSNTERGFFISYYSNCSRTITDLHGAIESPNFGRSYRRGAVDCAWTIKAPKGNRISLEFTHFDNADGSEIYLTDYTKTNGSVTHVLAEGRSFSSSGDTVLVVQNSSAISFRLEYSVTGCVAIFQRDTGTIQTPNFPRTYPNDVDCVWEIRTAPGQGIELTVSDLDIEESANCTHDALLISSEPHSANPKERHCGKQDSLHFSTSAHRLFMRFTSDGANNGKGFNATYRTVKSKCGGVMKSKNGVIMSPNYPQNYPPTMDCEWTIVVTDHHTVTLTLEELDVEEFFDCEMDYVEAYEELDEGDDAESAEKPRRQLFKRCGQLEASEANEWTSTSNIVVVKFKSDDSSESKGFKLSFRENCGERIEIDYGYLERVQIVRNSPSNETCVLNLISKDVTKHILFTPTHVQLHPAAQLAYRTEGDCIDRGVKIFDGEDDKAPLRSKFCKVHPQAITSFGHALTVQLPLGIVSEFAGNYIVLDNYCGGRYASMRGKFSSPFYPSSYPVNIACEWVIEASAGNSITLTIESLNLEQSDDCNRDYLEVRENDERGKLLALACGSSVPPTITSASSMWVYFSSDEDNVGEGFMASYSYAMHNELNGTDGVIESPKYPSKFASHEPYSWRITVDRDYVVLLTIKHVVDVDMPFIKFYDGYSDIGGEMEYASTHVVRSNTNILYLTAARGPFQFEWSRLSKEAIRSNRTAEEIAKVCGRNAVVVNNAISFNSPGYPTGYAPNLNCSWTLVAENPATHVVLNFVQIDLEEFANCLADYVRVSASSDLQNWKKLDLLCKKQPNVIQRYEGTPYLKVEFVTDSGVNKTGFSSYARAACGSELTGRSGLVNVTSLATRIDTIAMSCVWTIRARQGRRIRIKFLESTLRSPNETAACPSSFLVRNGIDEDSPFLGSGKYCDNNIADVLETTSNRAYIKFTRLGFQRFKAAFHYEEIATDCSDEIVLGEETIYDRVKTITSPKYPNIPNPHSECVWRIVAPAHHVIAVDFLDTFDLAAGAGPVAASCDREYVQLNDGGTELMPLIGKYCGTTKPDSKVSSGNVLRIKYFTDVSEPHVGFRANVSIGRCGGSYYNTEGVINSPIEFHFRERSQEYECVYTIESEVGSIIELDIEQIDLPSSFNCSDGTHLEVQEVDMYGEKENITNVLRVCGSDAKQVLVGTNKVVIRYKIKEAPSVHDVFKIRYKAIGSRCGETIEASRGILQTPGYPLGVRRPSHCMWRVRVPKGKRVKVELLDIDIGSRNDSYTAAGNHIGYLASFRGRIRFTNDFHFQSIIAQVTNNPPTELYSTDYTMGIDALLLPFGNYRGFRLRFSSDEDATLCRHLVDYANGGTLHFRRDNQSAIFCQYDLDMGANHTLALHVERYERSLELHNEVLCVHFSPLVLEFNGQDLVPDLMCKNETQPSVRLPFPATLVLSGNKRNRLQQLDIQYSTYACGGLRSVWIDDNLTISQPQVPGHSGRLECAWAVWPNDAANDFENMELWMEDVQLLIELRVDLKGSCEDQYILLYNGPNQNFPHLGRYCGQSSAMNLVVKQGLFFEYITASYETQSAFNLTVKHGSGCGGKLTYPYRKIVFSEQYQNNVECIWEIATDPGFHLGLTFVDRFFIEYDPECKKDYLRVQQRGLDGEWQTLSTLCGRDPPASVNTTTTEMRLIFRSNAQTTGDGFTAQFHRNCGGTLYASDESQQLASPGYPERYTSNLFCNYTILPRDGAKGGIVVRFLDLDIEEAPANNCIFDNVTVLSKDRYKEPSKAVLCGSSKNREFQAKEFVSVVFRTDTSFENKGFRIEYRNMQCGGVVTNATTIQSPRDRTEKFPTNTHCYWNLTAPAGHKILVKFEELEYEYQLDCLYDAVEVYEGKVPVANQRLARLCGNLTGHLPVLSINSNTGLVHSFSDESEPSRGFRALVRFVPDCDRKIFLDSSNATYEFTTYAGGYANDLDCNFVFSTLPGRQLQIEFSSFHLQQSDGCTDDFLQLYDGAGQFADSIGVFCGHEVPAKMMSSRDALFVRFVTDSQETSTGFAARIRSVPLACGAHNLEIKGSEKITLQSPDDGMGKYLPNLNCFWRIASVNMIHLQFEKLDLEPETANLTCANDFIKIYNSEDADLIEKGYGNNFVYSSRHQSSFHFNYAVQHVYCGDGRPDDYFSTTKEIFVKFRTDSTDQRSGFKIVASAVNGCFRNFTGTQGRILLSETADHCDIYIRAPQNHSLSLYYADVSFGEVDCTAEYLEVFDARTNTSLQKDCSYVAPGRSLFTELNELRLHIKMNTVYTQFDITYLASRDGPGCGGDLYNTAGLITSPFYPNNMRENKDCRWNIRVPSNLHVLLRFETFDLGAKTTCHSDYLQILEPDAAGREVVVGQFCGEDKPKLYKSKRSGLSVRFRKSVNYDGTGWVIRFSGVHEDFVAEANDAFEY